MISDVGVQVLKRKLLGTDCLFTIASEIMHNVCKMFYLKLLMPTLMYIFCDDYHVRYPSSQYKNQTNCLNTLSNRTWRNICFGLISHCILPVLLVVE